MTVVEGELVAGMAVYHEQLGPGTVIDLETTAVSNILVAKVAFWFVAPVVTIALERLKLVVLTDIMKLTIDNVMKDRKQL